MALLSVYHRLVRRDLQRSGVASKTISLQGAEVHYYEAHGSRDVPPVVLVHGFGDTAATWYLTIGPLARALGKVYALDLPGVGFSKLPPGKDHLNLEENVEVIARFCQEVVREPCLLVGQSLGGGLVLRLASRPLHPWVGVATVSPAAGQITLQELEDLRRAFSVPDRSATRQLLARIFTDPPLALYLMENDLRAVWSSVPMRKLIASMGMDDFVHPEDLARIQVPALVLWGTEERLLPLSMLDYLRRHFHNAQIEVVHGWGHAPQMEKPAEVVRRIVEFADTLPLAG